jgi:DNA-directed RNA polymerase specialized sigma24 family protein
MSVPSLELLAIWERFRQDGDLASLVEYCTPLLEAALRRCRGWRPGPVIEVADLVQQVWFSFWQRQQGDQPITSAVDLLDFLYGTACNKARLAQRHCLAGKRDPGRAVALDSMTEAEVANLPDSRPGPGRQVEWSDLLHSLPDHFKRLERAVLVLLLRHHTHKEMARILGVSVRTIGRICSQISPRILAICESGGATATYTYDAFTLANGSSPLAGLGAVVTVTTFTYHAEGG